MNTHRRHEEEWDTPPPGMVTLRLGDILDRGSEGEFIVVRISPSGAYIRPATTKKRTVTTTGGRSFEVTDYGRLTQVSRFTDRETIVGRDLNQLAELMNRKTKGNLMKLEPGDTIALGGESLIIFHVTDSTAQGIVHGEFRLETLDREQSDFLLTDKPRLNEVEREEALQLYLSKNNLTIETLTKNTNEHSMKTKTRQTKSRGGLAAAVAEANETAAAPKASRKKSAGASKAGAKKKEGRSHYTRELAKDLSLSVEEIHKRSKAKYPNSDMSTTKRLVEEGRAELKKETKAAERAEKKAEETTTVAA